MFIQRDIVPRSSGTPSCSKRSSCRYSGIARSCFSTMMFAYREEAVDLAPAIVVVVEESVQLRHHPSTGPHHDATNIVVIGRLVGDEDAVVIEAAVGDEHVEVDVQLQG
jgi:hypothetical protein